MYELIITITQCCLLALMNTEKDFPLIFNKKYNYVGNLGMYEYQHSYCAVQLMAI